MSDPVLNPAEEAARVALNSVFQSIAERNNFRLEAGAGAGKTYSLVKALKFIIDEKGAVFMRRRQQVACITFTNVATDEIISRTDDHPAIHASTIHAFCWSLIRGFQPFLRQQIEEMSVWQEKLEGIGGIGQRKVEYDLGYRIARPDGESIFLGHNDVIELAVLLMGQKKFRDLLTARYPILFLDEYQDTNAAFANSIVEHFVDFDEGPLIGLFGDSWQKIYGDGCGLIEHENLMFIGKEANFRSVKTIVDVLNRIRPGLPQEVKDPYSSGSVAVYHSNAWQGERRKGGHWGGDLPAEEAHRHLELLRTQLADEGWDFSPDRTKILMLTHKVLAAEQKFSTLASVFPYNEAYIKKEDRHISFLVDTLEPVCTAYTNGRYGEMFSALGARSVTIKSLDDKLAWANSMNRLVDIRSSGTIGQAIDHLGTEGRPRLPEALRKARAKLRDASDDEIEATPSLKILRGLRAVPYKEVVSLAEYLNEYTPFSTKHGVKGAEFENVLIVLGRGWNDYNWDKFFQIDPSNIPSGQEKFYERNRNLFYVVCSRPKKRMALLFTQKLSDAGFSRLRKWFGDEAVRSLEVPGGLGLGRASLHDGK